MEALRNKNGKNKNGNYQKFDDPEFEAEVYYAKENGLSLPQPPKKLPTETVKKIAEALLNGAVDKERVAKNGKAERKARSRGVSGCSSKKDGGRFEYGLDCVDMAYNENVFDASSTDSEAEYDEYSDYVFKYSDTEIRSIVQDYLLNGNKEEAMVSLEKFRITGDTMSRMMKDLIQLSLEAQAAGGLDLGTQLVNEIVQMKWLSTTTLVNIFSEIVDSLQELSIDSPKVVESMSVFIARMAEQGVLSTAVIKLLAGKAEEKGDSIAIQCYEDAVTFSENKVLLQGKCVPSGGHQSLEVLSAQFRMILKEYLHSYDKNVASLRVKELNVPHFTHEFIYQAGILALEKMHDTVMTNLADLLKQLYEDGTIVESCVQKGFEKLYISLSDLYLDLPAAYSLARRWVDKARKAEFISETVAKKCPIRARSRTLSEGPDGKLSCMDDEYDETKTTKSAPQSAAVQNGHAKVLVNGNHAV
jgi:programmed cell death protein 4